MGIECPECSGNARRSRARGFKERFARSVTTMKIYRCPECGWRGWVPGEEVRMLNPVWPRIFKTALVLLVVLATTVLALYITNNS